MNKKITDFLLSMGTVHYKTRGHMFVSLLVYRHFCVANTFVNYKKDES